MGDFKPSYSGIGKLLRSERMQAEMRRRAELIAARAEATAPEETGEYKASFEVESGVKSGKTRRAYGRVRNTSPHALYVEFGGGNTPRHRTIAKAIDAAKG